MVKLDDYNEVPWSQMSISDRCITIDGETFAIGSGLKYNVLDKTLAQEWTVRCSQKLVSTAQEVHTLENIETQEYALLIKTTAGSRRIDPLGTKAQSDISNHFKISDEKIIMKMIAYPIEKQEFYWTLFDAIS